jgi:DNA mismatch endonuclease (patch repair protein)
LNKINNNKANDEKALVELTELGWNVIYIWECELKSDKILQRFNQIKKSILS